jgi:hypothetical protein
VLWPEVLLRMLYADFLQSSKTNLFGSKRALFGWFWLVLVGLSACEQLNVSYLLR